MVGMKAYYQLFLHDEHGKLLWKSRRRRSKSFVLQWLQGICAQMKQGTVNIKTMDGSTALFSASTLMLQANAAAGVIYKGILVGTGTGAEANDNYCMGTRIGHGTGAGQLQYGSQAFTDPAIIAGNVDCVLTRAFVNGSGATVTVYEIGVAIHVASAAAQTDANCALGIRDVLPAGVNVLNGQTLTVQYTLRTTV